MTTLKRCKIRRRRLKNGMKRAAARAHRALPGESRRRAATLKPPSPRPTATGPSLEDSRQSEPRWCLRPPCANACGWRRGLSPAPREELSARTSVTSTAAVHLRLSIISTRACAARMVWRETTHVKGHGERSPCEQEDHLLGGVNAQRRKRMSQLPTERVARDAELQAVSVAVGVPSGQYT